MNRRIPYLSYFLLVCICLSLKGLGQNNIGTPFVKNYSKAAYQGGLQNWDIDQDQYGKIYFANNEGLLIFDGSNWELYPVKNRTIVRSLLIDGAKIYVGAQGEFGYFEPNQSGSLQYNSLKNLISKDYQNIGDVWDIVKHEGKILFRTSNKIFVYQDKIEVLAEDKNFSLLTVFENTTYVQPAYKGLYEIKNRQLELLFDNSPYKDFYITGITSIGNDLLIGTHRNGILKYNGNSFQVWETNDNDFIKEHRINHIIRIDENRIAVGTSSGGLFVLNNDGQVLHHYNVVKGLQSNDVLKVFKDGSGNLWLALGNGIDYIEISSPFSHIIPDRELVGTGYAVKIHNDKIYFGVSNGLYAADWKSYYNPLNSDPFRLINNTKGQVWNIDIVMDEVLVGHHEGTFRIEESNAIKLSNTPGTWAFMTLKDQNNKLISGNYSGLNLYDFENGQWKYEAILENMPNESCRILEEDQHGNIWVAHPYRGVYRIVLDIENKQIDSIKLYNSKNGFPSDLYIHVFKIANSVVFTGEYGIFEYNAQKDTFLISEKWGKLISLESRVHYLKEDKDGNIWFVADHKVGVFRVNDTGVEKLWNSQNFPQLTGRLVKGFEQIYPYDEQNVFFPMEQGFMHLNPSKSLEEDALFQVHLAEVELNGNLTVFGGRETENQKILQFPHHQNAFSFKYGASEYSTFFDPQFQYLLKGLDSGWSAWTKKNEKEYSALPYGKYEFQVRAKNGLGQITDPKTYHFEILPPWYATHTAFWIYLFIFLSLLLGLVLIPRIRFEKEKAELKEKQIKTTQAYEKIVAKNEAEISVLQREKLKTEIQFKNQELATTTMHLVQKSELINKLIENLQDMISETKEPKFKKSLRATIQLLNQNANLDEDWEQFSQYFDQVHANFIQRLSNTYPQLSPKDQRLCTYLRMNLSSKEIMLLMHISVRGIESSRYRLRKKLGLGSDVNLADFLMKF